MTIKRITVNGVQVRGTISTKTPFVARQTNTGVIAKVASTSYVATGVDTINVGIKLLADEIPNNGGVKFKYFEDFVKITEYFTTPKFNFLGDLLMSQDALTFGVSRKLIDTSYNSDTLYKGLSKRPATDILTSSDLVRRDVSKAPVDPLVSTEALVRTFLKRFVDVITVSDEMGFLQDTSVDLNDAFTQTDTLGKQLSRALRDNGYTVDSAAKSIQKAFTDTIVSNDSILGSVAIVNNASDSSSAIEVWSKTVAKALLDSNTSADSLTLHKDSYFSQNYMAGYYTGSLTSI